MSPSRPDVWSRLTGLAKFSRRLRSLLDDTITAAEAQALIAQGVARRDRRFLSKLDEAVYANPASPYRKLLEAAGCERGDIVRLVGTEGVEGTLGVLAEEGVFLSYQEFKCRRPTVRGSQTFHFSTADFNDPLVTDAVAATSSGTSGVPVSVPIDADHIAELAPSWSLFLEENGCLDDPLLFWTPGHPGVAARYLACARARQKYVYWFISEDVGSMASRAYAECVHRVARWAGDFPPPQRASFSEPQRVLQAIVTLLNNGCRPAVNTAPSAAVKLSLVAQHAGRDLRGVTFLLGAEPVTAARRRTIEASGASAVALYGSSEAPWIGGQCRHRAHADDVHVLLDGYAVIPAPDGGAAQPKPSTLLLTSLRQTLPKVLLNVDIGDRAMITSDPCDCLYDRLGCRMRLHSIHSADKITELGVTFAVADVFHLLEEALPRQFGGVAGDYQLVEARNADGLARYVMRINPTLAAIDEEAVVAAFFAELARLEDHYRPMVSAWARDRLVRVERAPALAAGSGKVLPFHRIVDGFHSGERLRA